MATQRDFNGDGTSDLLFSGDGDPPSADPRTDWFIQNGTYAGGGNIGPSTSGSFFTPLTGDFNGDGTTDLLLSSRDTGPPNNGDSLTEWLIQNGTHAGTVEVGAIPSGWTLKSAGDFNGDGTSDLLFKSYSGDLATWFLHDGAYAGGTNIGTIPSGWSLIGTSDFNGDGTTDLLFENSAGLLATWFIHDGAYAGGTNIGALPSGWSLKSAGDYNGDGTTDLLFENSAGLLATWFIHDGAYAGGTHIGTILEGWRLRGGSGDFNGDGTTDLLFDNNAARPQAASTTVGTWFIHDGAYTGGTNISVPDLHLVTPNASRFLASSFLVTA